MKKLLAFYYGDISMADVPAYIYRPAYTPSKIFAVKTMQILGNEVSKFVRPNKNISAKGSYYKLK